jgi:hypothetical protein
MFDRLKHENKLGGLILISKISRFPERSLLVCVFFVE